MFQSSSSSLSSISNFPKPINRVAIICHILPFLTNDIYDAIHYSSISPAFRDAIQNYASVLWIQIWNNFLQLVSNTFYFSPTSLSSSSSINDNNFYRKNSRESTETTSSASSSSYVSAKRIKSIVKYDAVRRFCRIFGASVRNSGASVRTDYHRSDDYSISNNSTRTTSPSCGCCCPVLWVLPALHHQGQANFNGLIDNDHGTPLNKAIGAFSSVEAVKVLISSCGADPNFCGIPLEENLLFPSSSSSATLSSLLLFPSPLFCACSFSSPEYDEIVKILLDHGADPLLCNSNTFSLPLLSSSSVDSSSSSKSNALMIKSRLINLTKKPLRSDEHENEITVREFLRIPKDTLLLTHAGQNSSLTVVKMLLSLNTIDPNQRPWLKLLSTSSSSSSSTKNNTTYLRQRSSLLSSVNLSTTKLGGNDYDDDDDDDRNAHKLLGLKRGNTLLETIIERNKERDKDLLEYLVLLYSSSEKQIDVNLPSPSSHITPIVRACRVRNLVAVKTLLKTGKVDLDAVTKSGKNALLALLSEVSPTDESNASAATLSAEKHNISNENDHEMDSYSNTSKKSKQQQNSSSSLFNRYETETVAVFPHRIFHCSSALLQSSSNNEDNNNSDDEDVSSLFGDDGNHQKGRTLTEDSDDNDDNDQQETKRKSTDELVTTPSPSAAAKELRRRYKFLTEDDICAEILKLLIEHYYKNEKNKLSKSITNTNVRKEIEDEAKINLVKNFICFQEKTSNKTALMYAAFNGYLSCVKILLNVCQRADQVIRRSEEEKQARDSVEKSSSFSSLAETFLLMKDSTSNMTAMQYCASALGRLERFSRGGEYNNNSSSSIESRLTKVQKQNMQETMKVMFDFAKTFPSSTSSSSS